MAYARNQLRLVVVGHVDHGKSTLIGRLFYDTGSLPDGKYEQLVAIAQRRGVPFEFANLMDALQAERDQKYPNGWDFPLYESDGETQIGTFHIG